MATDAGGAFQLPSFVQSYLLGRPFASTVSKCAATSCSEVGIQDCTNCNLVKYCTDECREEHSDEHKVDCLKGDPNAPAFQPRWTTENRARVVERPSAASNTMNGNDEHYVWGNTPATDILNMTHNEGNDYAKPLHLLFAASGDLRNFFSTIAALPASYKQPIYVAINDMDDDVYVRNVMLLILCFSIPIRELAAVVVAQLWYSARLSSSIVTTIKDLNFVATGIFSHH